MANCSIRNWRCQDVSMLTTRLDVAHGIGGPDQSRVILTRTTRAPRTCWDDWITMMKMFGRSDWGWLWGNRTTADLNETESLENSTMLTLHKSTVKASLWFGYRHLLQKPNSRSIEWVAVIQRKYCGRHDSGKMIADRFMFHQTTFDDIVQSKRRLKKE